MAFFCQWTKSLTGRPIVHKALCPKIGITPSAWFYAAAPLNATRMKSRGSSQRPSRIHTRSCWRACLRLLIIRAAFAFVLPTLVCYGLSSRLVLDTNPALHSPLCRLEVRTVGKRGSGWPNLKGYRPRTWIVALGNGPALMK